MLPVFKQAGRSILLALGEDAFLRGEGPFKVNIEHSVQVFNDVGEFVGLRSVATISADAEPALGDLLQHPDGDFTLDATQQSNGVNLRFVLKPVT